MDITDSILCSSSSSSSSSPCRQEDDRETWEKRRAAKAKDWDREMRKKTEALKTYLIGCVWRNSKGSSERDRKALECFKAVPLVSMPILLTGVAKSGPSGKDKQASSRTSGTKGTQILAVHNKIRPVPKEGRCSAAYQKKWSHLLLFY